MTPPPAITIPRRADESPRAYAARVEYITAGPQRSQEALSQKLGKSRQLIGRWSVAHGWADAAAQYDQTCATLAAQQAGAAYLADLEKHRTDAMQYGKALCSVAVKMLAQLDGELRRVEYTPAALATIARALTTGMDLQAHALRVADLLPRLESDAEPD